MDYLISFVVSVMAIIAAYIVRKWIDKQSHDKIKRPLYGNTAASLVRPTGFEPAAL